MSSKFLAIYLLLALLSRGTNSYMASTASGWDDQDFFRHCPVSRCSKDGPEIRFPHRLQSSNTSSACGASCANLTCSGRDTILQHPYLGPCKVTSIDYNEAVMNITLLLVLVDTSSPCSLQNLTFFDPLPSYYDYSRCELYSWVPAKLVRCSKEITLSGPVEVYPVNPAENIAGPISCHSDTGKYFSYLVHAQLHMSLLPVHCRIVSRGTIQIPGQDYYYITGPRPTFKERAEKIVNFAEATLTWWFLQDEVNYNCTTCELHKQRCAFSSQRNQTFCMSHGNHHGTIPNCTNMIVPPQFYSSTTFPLYYSYYVSGIQPYSTSAPLSSLNSYAAKLFLQAS